MAVERDGRGKPVELIPNGVSVDRSAEMAAVLGARNPEMFVSAASDPESPAAATFNRSLVKPRKAEEEDKTWSGSSYMPKPFVPGLPSLGGPTTRIYRDPPITTLDEWSIGDIKGALQSHTIGQFLSSARLADAMTADDRVASVLGTRVKGMLGLPFKVRARRNRKGKYSDEAKTARDIVRRYWSRMVPRPMIAEFLQWGIQMGFALAEVVWRVHRSPVGKIWLPTIRTWHPQLVYYRYDERCYYVITMDGPVRVTPGDGKWILYAPHGEYRGWMHGIVRTCAAPWRYRTNTFRDWARHAEKHGFPWVLARVPLQAKDEDKNRFFQSLMALGSEPTILTPKVDANQQFDVDLKEAQHPAADVFDKFTERCDTLISCAVLGQNLTTEVQGGSYAAATVHGQVRQDFLEADAVTLAECLRQQLLRPFCVYNFEHGSRIIPSVGWDTTPPDDKRLSAQTIQSFAGAIAQLASSGFPVDVKLLAQQFGVPITEDGQPTLKPQQKPGGFEQHELFTMINHLQNALPMLEQIHANLAKLIAT